MRWADCTGIEVLKMGWETPTHTNTYTHIHTQMQALNPTPKHLFRVFLSSFETTTKT